jgi:5-methylcytosine-specific restriction endonuclease McrA
MAKQKTITKTTKYRAAIRKVRCTVNRERKKTVKKLMSFNNSEESVIQYFLKFWNITPVSGFKKQLQQLVLDLYLEGHEAFKVTFPRRKKLSKEERIKAMFDKYNNDPFFGSEDWQKLRKIVLKTYGRTCMKCGHKNTTMHVDHIKPRSKYPDLQFDFNNLQVLCAPCNIEKSNIDETDYRNITINITNNFNLNYKQKV